MSDENRMITFNYARTTWDQYKKQTIPTSQECMTKDDINTYLNADMGVLNAYATNQLIPRSKFVGANLIDKIKYKSSGVSIGTALFKTTLAEAMSTTIGSPDNGVEFILNGGSDISASFAKIYINETNKHIPKKIRITYSKTVNNSNSINKSVTDNVINGRGGKIVADINNQNVELAESIIYDLPQPIPHNYQVGTFKMLLYYLFFPAGCQNAHSQLTFYVEVLDSSNNVIQIFNYNNSTATLKFGNSFFMSKP